MMVERKFYRLFKGGSWYDEDDCPSNNYSLHINDMEDNVIIFNFKGYGKYDYKNDENMERLSDFINRLLNENKRLKDEQKIQKGWELVFNE